MLNIVNSAISENFKSRCQYSLVHQMWINKLLKIVPVKIISSSCLSSLFASCSVLAVSTGFFEPKPQCFLPHHQVKI